MFFLPLSATLMNDRKYLRMFDVDDTTLLRYDHLIVHCAATPPSLDDIGADWIDSLHRRPKAQGGNGWKNGNGYHIVIPRDGNIQSDLLGDKCRPLSMHGAHVGDCGPGWNTRSLGICLVGGVDESGRPDNNFTDQQFEALKFVIRLLYRKHPKPWILKTIGHRDLIKLTGASPKACPCFDVQEWIENEGVLDKFDYQGDREDADKEGTGRMAIPETHEVRKGESYWSIAKKYGIRYTDMRDLNHIRPERLRPGDILKLR